MTWGRSSRTLRQELGLAVAKATAVTGLLLAAHVSNAILTDFDSIAHGRSTQDAPATVSGDPEAPRD